MYSLSLVLIFVARYDLSCKYSSDFIFLLHETRALKLNNRIVSWIFPSEAIYRMQSKSARLSSVWGMQPARGECLLILVVYPKLQSVLPSAPIPEPEKPRPRKTSLNHLSSHPPSRMLQTLFHNRRCLNISYGVCLHWLFVSCSLMVI